jgi:hypothetical protein
VKPADVGHGGGNRRRRADANRDERAAIDRRTAGTPALFEERRIGSGRKINRSGQYDPAELTLSV